MYILKFLGVMVSMILADVAWTQYFIKVSERKSLSSGIWSASIIIFGAICTMNYVGDPTMLVAAGIGAFIGTYITVEYKKRKSENV